MATRIGEAMTTATTLRALSEAATPGPWRLDGRDIIQLTDAGQGYPMDYYPDSADIVRGRCSHCGDAAITRHENAEFIAAANPQTVIALLDEIDGCRAPEAHWTCQQRIDQLEQQLAAMTTARNEACSIAETAIRMQGDFVGRNNKLGSERVAELRKVAHD